MVAVIREQLKTVERENNVRILLACESGSRAWGFPSPDSDYDVRFIYVHSTDYYLSIEDQRDVIELPVNQVLDINGWELRKALRLFKKSNGPLFEWLQSPVIYQQDDQFAQGIRKLMPDYFSPRSAMHHYLSMGKTVYHEDLAGRSQVKLKRYFYALRPLLACRWIADRREVPPMEFGKLRTQLSSDLNEIVDKLLQQKSVENEKFTIESIDLLDSFIRNEIEYSDQAVSGLPLAQGTTDALNDLFRKYIK